ncbi:MAG: hypothetical protein H6660_16875 [Ardenticatenaceae bacterium]|nr:hypothetical protein [Ardenticatenaceae bacterium]
MSRQTQPQQQPDTKTRPRLPTPHTTAQPSLSTLLQRAEADPQSLTPHEYSRLQQTIGNRAIGQLVAQPRSAQGQIQFKLENTSLNDVPKLGPYRSAVETYAAALSDAVEDARDMIATKYFVHIPAVDGYMQNFLDNFDVGNNKFKDGAAMPRQAGYWIESYVTKVAKPSVGGGLDVILQPKRGNSRPDVVLQFKGVDIAWLDITSSVSEGHIFDKDSAGWYGTPYVTEVTYAGLKLNVLNTVAIPDKSTKDISGLLEKAKEAYKRQLVWETAVLEKHGFSFGTLMHDVYYYVKNSAVKHEEEMDMEDQDMDNFYSPDVPGNKFENLALSFIEDKIKKKPDPRELAAVIMYWQTMVSRYEKQFEATLPPQYHLPGKKELGLSWVTDASSADGEPLIREWFPV